MMGELVLLNTEEKHCDRGIYWKRSSVIRKRSQARMAGPTYKERNLSVSVHCSFNAVPSQRTKD